jgi:hypothetical protein
MTPDIHTVLVLDEVGRKIPMKLIQPLYSITYVAALEAEVAELRKNAVQLYTGLIRARQSLFPHVDQEKVMARDYPKIASLKEAS